MPNRLLTVAETARELGCSPDTVYRRVESGAWPAVRLGEGPKAPIRLDPDELAARLLESSLVSSSLSGLLSLEAVAARIGKQLEWCIARTRILPCLQRPDGMYVDEGDLPAWREAAREKPQERAQPFREDW